MGSSKVFLYKGHQYPDAIRRGNAVKFITPIAKEFCEGEGIDIGATQEWCLPGAQPINPDFTEFDAYKLPDKLYDYVFSSHCLEHLEDPIKALTYWKSHLKDTGCMFLYLPHPDMKYWLPQNCRKHRHFWRPEDMLEIFQDIGMKDVLCSERDLYWSFSCVGYVDLWTRL